MQNLKFKKENALRSLFKSSNGIQVFQIQILRSQGNTKTLIKKGRKKTSQKVYDKRVLFLMPSYFELLCFVNKRIALSVDNSKFKCVMFA
jgi:hypothetical protein